MRKTKILAIFLTVCLMMGMLPSTGLTPGQTNPSAAAEKLNGTLYIFDLKTFLSRLPNSVAKYDYFKLATALQGLVNRDNPQIYMLYESGYYNIINGFDIDRFWLEELSKDGKYLSDTNLDYYTYPPTLDGFYRLLSDFSGFYNGFVLWDHNVPATANVASTAAGADNLLPVRYYPNDRFSLYSALFGPNGIFSQDDIKLDLVGKFTGAPGFIWDSSMTSTGSTKNDAYLWAKDKYLDAGKTNPLRMAYAIDSWVKPADMSETLFVTVAVPDEMYPGETARIQITVKNNSNEIWRGVNLNANTPHRLGNTEENQFWFGGRCEMSGTVNPGQEYTFEFNITAPNEPGYATLGLAMVQEAIKWLSGSYSKTIEIKGEGPVPSEVRPIPEPKPAEASITYNNLFETMLASSDYLIADKAFFFDLSMNANISPIDDRSQARGEDVRTMRALLLSNAQQSGFNIFNIAGFSPWYYKYCDFSDPQSSGFSNWDSEWTMINILSSYGGQLEGADISNGSVYMKVPLNEELKQNNNKGRDNELTYQENKHYISIYMGDYDAVYWTAGYLTMFFEQSKNDRGKYPLGWPIPTGISGRIPQLFNYIYENATPNDFFIAGDNGTAYLNSSMFESNLRPAGMPDMLETWEKYNIMMNKRFDIDVLGLHINMSTSTLSNTIPSQRVMESIARMTPVGASVQSQTSFMPQTTERFGTLNLQTRTIRHPLMITNASNGAVTPFINYQDIGGAGTTAQQLANSMFGYIQDRTSSYTTQYFHNFRCILIPPSIINEALDILKGMTGANFEVVDPYTMYRLAGQQWGTQAVSFDANGGTEVAGVTATVRDRIYTIPEDPTREGYAFGGWFADEALTIPWDFSKDTVWENITLYAKWISTVSYYAEGELVFTDTVAAPDSYVTALPIPSKLGFTFAGWFTEDGEAFTTGTEVAGDVSVFAMFDPKIIATGVEPGNKQCDVNFPIVSANGKGYTLYLSKTGIDGPFAVYSDVNYNSKGAHVKGLENGKTYYVIIEYVDSQGDVSRSNPIKITT